MHTTIQKTEIRDRRLFLKVKLKSLAAEAKIIRAMEGRHPAWRAELRSHRIFPVRREARHTLLAYGFLRGRTLHAIEAKSDHPPDWKAVAAMVKKYGAVTGGHWKENQAVLAALLERFDAWQHSKLDTPVAAP